MTAPNVIDGEVAAADPHTTWTCPHCPRRITDETGRRSGLVCAGHPTTGRTHPAAAMRRDPPATTAIEVRRRP